MQDRRGRPSETTGYCTSALAKRLLIGATALTLTLLSVLPTAAADRRLFELIHDDLRTDLLDEIVPVVNDFGDSKYVIGAVLLTTVLGTDDMRDTGLLVGAGFAASALTSLALKSAIGRPRPLNPEDTYSMPSGHATVAFSAATALAHRYPRWRLAFYTVAGGVAFARVYLGRHYPSDVLAGAVVGVGITRLVLRHEQKILSISF
jgi:undecaprenyl-diphosphatase